MIQRARKTFASSILPAPSTVQFCGFDTDDASEGGNFSGPAGSIQSLVTYAGQPFAFRSNPTTTQIGAYRLLGQGPTGIRNSAPISSVATSFVRFYFLWKVLPTITDAGIFLATDQPDNFKFHIHINTSGQLVARTGSGAGSVVGTGTTALQQNNWYRIESMFGTGNPAPWQINLAIGDGPAWTELSGNSNLGAGNCFQTIYGLDSNDFSNAVDFYIANIYWSSSGFPGPGHTALLAPAADGFYVAGNANGTATRWQSVNSVPPADDVKFINGLVGSGAYTAKVNGKLKGKIKCVKAYARAKRDSTNAGFMSRLRSNGIDTDTVDAGLGYASYTSLIKIYEVNPFTLQPWQAADVNNLEVGFIQNPNGGPIRVSGCFVVVDYMPG